MAYDETRGKSTVAWSAAAISLKNYNEFLTALKTDKLDDTRDYYH